MIGRFLCRIGWHRWRPIRTIFDPLGGGLFLTGEVYACRRCDEPWHWVTEVVPGPASLSGLLDDEERNAL